MSKDKKLSPKQKKIAAMAGDPNRIEGEDFQKLKTMKAKDGVSVDHSMDHPDVVAVAKSKKKDREEFQEEYPILSKLMPKGSDKKDKESAKRMVDHMQTEGAKIRTATEGSFSKGGSVMARGNKIARSKPTKLY